MTTRVREAAKRLGSTLAPRLTASVLAARARAHSHRSLRDWGYDRLTSTLVEQLGDRVLEGPFAGLVLSPMTRAEHLGPFLLGVYESELDPVWAVVFERSYPQIVDVGAKFGYYAVGLARRFRDVPVVAFDVDPWARAAVREMAAANETPNVEVLGFCDAAWLARRLAPGALVISDCEGYEARLFAAPLPAVLAAATLVIESHDCFVPGITRDLQLRLRPTHDVQVLETTPARRGTHQPLTFLPDEKRRAAAEEIRPPQAWIFATPRHEDRGTR